MKPINSKDSVRIHPIVIFREISQGVYNSSAGLTRRRVGKAFLKRLTPSLKKVVPCAPNLCNVKLRTVGVLLCGGQSSVEQIVTCRHSFTQPVD